MRKANIFLYFCLVFIFGIGLRSFVSLDIYFVFVFAIICLAAGILLWPKRKIRFILFGAVFLFFGIWRYQISVPKMDENFIGMYNSRTVEVIGHIAAEPEMREKNQKLTTDDIRLTTNNKKLKGKILVNANKFEKYNYGDEISFKCFLEKPGVIESEDKFRRNFDYGKYLGVKSVYTVCYKPENLVVIHSFNRDFTQLTTRLYANVFSKIISVKQKFKEKINQNLPLPQAGLLAAILLGERGEISAELNEQFSATGLTHIIAISGLNITLIAGLLWYALALLGLNKNKSFWLGALILFLYVLMVGFMASAARALVMGLILMYALKIGRLSKANNALAFSAAVLLIFNPKLLVFDIGFQLSFLAVLGMAYFYPQLEKWLEFAPDKFKFRSMMAMTLSAQILTLPIIIYYFGRVSLVTLLANVLVLPVLTVLTIGGMAMIAMGFIWPAAAFVLGIMEWAVVSYVIKVVEILSRFPLASFKIKVLPFWPVVMVYGAIIFWMVRRERNKGLGE